MERQDYINRINDLLQAVETLLKSNNAMGEKLEETAAAYEDLKVRYDRLEGELAMRKRGQHGRKSEKPKDTAASDSGTGKTKDEDEYGKEA